MAPSIFLCRSPIFDSTGSFYVKIHKSDRDEFASLAHATSRATKNISFRCGCGSQPRRILTVWRYYQRENPCRCVSADQSRGIVNIITPLRDVATVVAAQSCITSLAKQSALAQVYIGREEEAKCAYGRHQLQ